MAYLNFNADNCKNCYKCLRACPVKAITVIDERARIDDRLLDVIVLSELPKWKILLLLPTAFFGKHVRFRGISIFRCREIEVKTGKRLPIHTDGEPIAWGDTIRASLEPEQIRVIAPPQE